MPPDSIALEIEGEPRTDVKIVILTDIQQALRKLDSRLMLYQLFETRQSTLIVLWTIKSIQRSTIQRVISGIARAFAIWLWQVRTTRKQHGE